MQKICTTLAQSWPVNCPFAVSACANAVFLLALVLNHRKLIFSEYSLDKLLQRKYYDDTEAYRPEFQDNLDKILDPNEAFIKESVRLKVVCGRRNEYTTTFSAYLDLGEEHV